MLTPPYSVVGAPARGFDALGPLRADQVEPIAGAILVARPEIVTAGRPFSEITWIRTSFPWLSLVAVAPESSTASIAASTATTLARRGTIVVANPDLTPTRMAAAVRDAFIAELDVGPWLAGVLPAWPARRRDVACDLLIEGFGRATALEKGRHPTPSHARLWRRVGRALGGALAVQVNSGAALERTALEVGYHDVRSLDRALRRYFGTPSTILRDTAGWEWLLWRFLSGFGDGREKNWDR